MACYRTGGPVDLALTGIIHDSENHHDTESQVESEMVMQWPVVNTRDRCMTGYWEWRSVLTADHHTYTLKSCHYLKTISPLGQFSMLAPDDTCYSILILAIQGPEDRNDRNRELAP